MNLLEMYERARRELRDAGIPSSDSEARFIVSHISGIPPLSVPIKREVEVDGGEEKLLSILDRRKRREPLQLIVGKWDFYGREFFLGRGVLVPRQETEILVGEAVKRLSVSEPGTLKGLEVGCGSGVISISLLLEMENVSMRAVDVSKEAVRLTKKNGEFHGVSRRLQVVRSDYTQLSGDTEKIDFIVSNPPYLSRGDLCRAMPEVKEYEPEKALLGGEGGVEFIEGLLEFAGDILNKGGYLMCEIGYGQSEKVRTIAGSTGKYASLEFVEDLSHIQRVAVARKK